jgi:hypothetical protein
MGYLYLRGRVWWCKYYQDGRAVRESTGATGQRAAEHFLKKRAGRVAEGQPILPRADRLRYDALANDLREHYKATGSRDVDEAESRLQHLDLFFTGRRVASIGQAEVTDYARKRQGEGAANATVNREIAVLVRMLRLGYEAGKVLRLPVIRKLKENGPRAGLL